MQLHLFVIYNKVYNHLDSVLVEPSAGVAIRNNSPYLQKMNPHFLEDTVLYDYGFFEESDGLPRFVPIPDPVAHDWSEYKHPETPVEPLPQGTKHL